MASAAASTSSGARPGSSSSAPGPSQQQQQPPTSASDYSNRAGAGTAAANGSASHSSYPSASTSQLPAAGSTGSSSSSSSSSKPGNVPYAATMARLRRRCPASIAYILARILTASTRLETSTSPSHNLRRLRQYRFTRGDKVKYAIMLLFALFSMWTMRVPGFPLKLGIPLLYTALLFIPLTSQFFLPAAPILCWLLFFYSSKFIPASTRPHIWVSLLPTLETIWYGANISDILTRFGHPILDILAWFPYGVIHFVAPFVVAACLFVFGPPGSVKFFSTAFGFMNLCGVFIQIILPCAPPWYELREGLTPANYSMKGSPAGLARIDALFHGHGYTLTFSNAPVPFGAFPSLHAGCATMEALFCSYFFPIALNMVRGRVRVDSRLFYWAYCFWLYWCTMYLMHHYLIDLVAGGCLATLSFYFFLTDDMRIAMEQNYPYRNSAPAPLSAGPSVSRPGSAFGSRRTGVGAGAGAGGGPDGSEPSAADLTNGLAMSVFHSSGSSSSAAGGGGGGVGGTGTVGGGAGGTTTTALAQFAEAILSPGGAPQHVPDEEAQAPVLMSSASASALRAQSSGGLISRTASPAPGFISGGGGGVASNASGVGSSGGSGNPTSSGVVGGSGSSRPGTPHARSSSGGGGGGGGAGGGGGGVANVGLGGGFTPINAGERAGGVASYFGADLGLAAGVAAAAALGRTASPRPKRDSSEGR